MKGWSKNNIRLLTGITKHTVKENGYSVWFTVDNQTFSMMSVSTRKMAVWYRKQLRIALNKLQKTMI